MNRKWRGGLILLSTLFIVGYGIAQNTCSTLIESALESVANACTGMSRNQVCYGNISLALTPISNAPDFTFEQVGDIADVTYIRSLKLAPLDELQGVWGIAMMQLQADIPESLPGQNVTFLVFGDVEMENTSSADQSPMQSFYLRTAVGDASCVDTPASGLIIQTPHGVQSVQFNINGVDVEIGSTVLLQAKPDQEFVLRTLEGAAVVTIAGQSYPVIAGTEMSIPVDAQMQPSGLPSLPIPISETDLQGLPTAPLPREILPPTSLPEAVTEKLYLRLEEGLEPCNVPGLPACEHSLTPNGKRKWAKKDAYAAAEQTNIIATASDAPPMAGTEDAALPGDIGNPVLTEAPVATDAPTSAVIDASTSVTQAAPPSDSPEEKEKKEKEEKEKKEKEEKEKKEKEEKEKKDKEKKDNP
jgi:hypothetical protein